MNALVKLERARDLLAEVCSVNDAKRIMALADAAEIYARRVQAGEEAVLYAHRIKVDAQTILGTLIPKPLRGKPPVNRRRAANNDNGVSRYEAATARQLAEAKSVAPEIHEAVRQDKLPIRELSKELLLVKESQEERKRRERLEVVRATTRVYEDALEMVMALDGFDDLDPEQGRHPNDPKRRLTPNLMRDAGENLLRVARLWSQHERQKGTHKVRH